MNDLKIIETNLRSICVNDIESIKAEYIDKDYIREPVYFNYRINSKGKRFYARVFENNEIVTAPSFSAIKETCSPMPWSLIEWYIKNGKEYCDWFKEHSANYGTYFHMLCGMILRGEKITTTRSFFLDDMRIFFDKKELDYNGCFGWMQKEKRDLRKDLYGFCKWCQDYKVRPLAIEYPVMHPEGLYAGTIDLVCYITLPLTKIQIEKGENEKEIIIGVDLKSGMKGFYEEHEIQLHAYMPLWNIEYPELQWDRVYNYGCHNFRIPLSANSTFYKFKDQTKSKVAYKWDHWVSLFHADPENAKITNKTDFNQDQELSIEADLDTIFATEDPLAFVTAEAF
jgi:hypothetical protein